MRASVRKLKETIMGIALTVLIVSLIPIGTATADQNVINLIGHPDTAYSFDANVDILELVYPPVSGADACILRCSGQVMMIDGASTRLAQDVVLPLLRRMGIKSIDCVLNTHPHDDHMCGFEEIVREIPIGRALIGFAEDYNWVIARGVRTLRAFGAEIETVSDGMTVTLGQAELTLFQRVRTDFTTNDRSVCALIKLGSRTLLSVGDCENRAQAMLLEAPPACGLRADILKYPHHGHDRMVEAFWHAVDPEAAVITSAPFFSRRADAFLERMGCETVVHTRPGPHVTSPAPIRLRTDGTIWVIDYFPEDGE